MEIFGPKHSLCVLLCLCGSFWIAEEAAMTSVLEQAKPYLTDYERFDEETAASTRPSLRRLRQSAIARFADLGFPGPRDEEWRFTSVAPLLKYPFDVFRSEESAVPSLQSSTPELPPG